MSKIGIDRRIRANLIRLRLSARLDQNCLARKSGVTHLAQIESGSRAVGKTVLEKLAKTLGVDIYEFFLPEDLRVLRDDDEKIFIDLVDACTLDGRKFILNTLLDFIRYEKKK